MNNPKRRQFIKETALITLGSSLLSESSHAIATKLNPKDPAAAALGYVENASKVDTQRFPGYKLGQNCASCALILLQYSPYRPCKIFPKNLVNANGWCSAWVKNPNR